jgi:hypothetical protein
MVVQVREARQRIGGGHVDVARDVPERAGHDRERQQGDGGQAPVDAQHHDRQDHDQRERAVKAGQHGFAGGHFDRIDIVGGQRHQVAGALLLVKRRALRGQARVQARAQLDAKLVGGAIQAHAPHDPQHVDGQAEREQLGQFQQQRMMVECVGGEAVDGGADGARHPDRADGHADQHAGGRRIGAPVAAHESADEAR